jgi:hypothetical protein
MKQNGEDAYSSDWTRRNLRQVKQTIMGSGVLGR